MTRGTLGPFLPTLTVLVVSACAFFFLLDRCNFIYVPATVIWIGTESKVPVVRSGLKGYKIVRPKARVRLEDGSEWTIDSGFSFYGCKEGGPAEAMVEVGRIWPRVIGVVDAHCN